MKPLDPRLVRTAGAVRVHLAVTVLCGVAVTGLVLAQAWLVARVISGAAAGEGLTELSWAVAAVAAVALGRAALSYGTEAAALHSAARAKSQLRRRLIAHVTGVAPAGAPEPSPGQPGRGAVWLSGHHGPDDGEGDGPPRAGELATLATRGLDALDDYFARYLPQLVLAVLVPLAVLAVVARAYCTSALVPGLTVPLGAAVRARVGWPARAGARRHGRLPSRPGGHVRPGAAGLAAIAVFRRAKAQAA